MLAVLGVAPLLLASPSRGIGGACSSWLLPLGELQGL